MGRNENGSSRVNFNQIMTLSYFPIRMLHFSRLNVRGVRFIISYGSFIISGKAVHETQEFCTV